MLEKGSYVEIVQEVLKTDERASNIPQETKETPLKLWVKGQLIEDSDVGSKGKIITATGRILEGIITGVNPTYIHNFGEFVGEIMFVGPQCKKILWGDKDE